ncbi:DUF2157 domain-containing protein [Tepidibacter hydrothermalis]|uniref:DUF2157 domain-containing protein n=1 Tax=Tepidibacter hydrothermalis TaxID=3036126 RepID=A0ABY8EBM7_9FIRM|nr:DUF2157 domain-containing protein [Tepidibacter hydrothermalis]WFD10356.1 DUF2157 domain-containing protein [Tepidibacter hydrothermalis]
MKKRKISKNRLNFLEEELEFMKKENLISPEQKIDIIDNYDIVRLNFVRIILTIGAILVGLGIISFIASNWNYISKITKVFMIIGSYIGFNILSYKLENKYPKTSKSFLYIGALIYGAGIFLIGQIFHYEGHFSKAFLFWGVGIIPLALLFKDKLVFIFSHVFLLVYLMNSYNLDYLSYFIILIIPVLYYINNHLGNSKVGTFFNNLVLLSTVLYFLGNYNVDEFYTTVVFLIIGLFMYYGKVNVNRDIFKIQGLIVFGISGLILTSPYIWEESFKFIKSGVTISLIFSLLYVLYLFHETNKGNLISLIFICITIIRYYFDTFYDFMPKSMFFITSGAILLLFGHYFERMRNKRGGEFIEK